VSQTAVSQTAVWQTAVSQTALPQTTAPQTAVLQTAVLQTTVLQTTRLPTWVPQTVPSATRVSQTAVSQTAVPQTAVPQTAVPQTAVPQAPAQLMLGLADRHGLAPRRLNRLWTTRALLSSRLAGVRSGRSIPAQANPAQRFPGPAIAARTQRLRSSPTQPAGGAATSAVAASTGAAGQQMRPR